MKDYAIKVKSLVESLDRLQGERGVFVALLREADCVLSYGT